LPGLRIPVSELLWPPQSCLRRQPESRPKPSKLPPRSRMSSPPSSPGTSPRPSRFPPRSSGSSSEFKVALEFQPNNIEIQSCLRISPSIPEALRFGSKSPEVALWSLGVASEWYPFQQRGRMHRHSPLMRSLFSQFQTPTAPRSRRFFQVWLPFGLPRLADHPALRV